MPAGQQVALQPALAGVLGQDLDDPAVRARGSGPPGICAPASLAGDLQDRAQPVGLGLVGAEDPEVALGRVRRMTSRSMPPSTRVGSDGARAGLRRPGPRSRGSPAGSGRAAAGRRWRAGWRRAARSPCGTRPSRSAARRAVGVEQLLRPVGAQPLLELPQVRGVGRGPRPAAPGAPARCPRPAGRRPRGPVQPFGVRSTIIGHRRARSPARAASRAAPWMARISPSGARRARRPSRWCMTAGSSPVT